MVIQRKTLPTERPAITRRFQLAYTHKNGETDTMKFYFTVGMYDDGSPAEIFVKADKTGTLAAGALDACAIMMSIALQHGIPLRALTDKLKGTRFGPGGFTKDPEIKSCTSPFDLLAHWLELKFPEDETKVITEKEGLL
jgi:ribonucleoside-diphosphate reductase alpha chain